jgi:hypothetical protein
MWMKKLAIATLTTSLTLLTCGTHCAHAQSATSSWNQSANSKAQKLASAVVQKASLPPCTMDSFVHEAYEHAEHIYGDEGSDGPPPYMGFDEVHRINTGIMDQRDQGLTTGHGSWMPRAVGKDEFLGQEWSQSGPTGAHSDAGGVGPGGPSGSDGSDGGDGSSGGSIPPGFPPSPGQGYQIMYQHGEAVGWWSPAEIALSQTDFPAALRSIVNSDRYYGGALGRDSILYEIGDISSPFGDGTDGT